MVWTELFENADGKRSANSELEGTGGKKRVIKTEPHLLEIIGHNCIAIA